MIEQTQHGPESIRTPTIGSVIAYRGTAPLGTTLTNHAARRASRELGFAQGQLFEVLAINQNVITAEERALFEREGEPIIGRRALVQLQRVEEVQGDSGEIEFKKVGAPLSNFVPVDLFSLVTLRPTVHERTDYSMIESLIARLTARFKRNR